MRAFLKQVVVNVAEKSIIQNRIDSDTTFLVQRGMVRNSILFYMRMIKRK